jgi:dihydrofolate reductase
MMALGEPGGSVGVIGGTDVFELFLDLYSVFYLSRVPNVRLPGGRPVFPEVPTKTPEEVLARHSLARNQIMVLDPTTGLTLSTWRRSSPANCEVRIRIPIE